MIGFTALIVSISCKACIPYLIFHPNATRFLRHTRIPLPFAMPPSLSVCAAVHCSTLLHCVVLASSVLPVPSSTNYNDYSKFP